MKKPLSMIILVGMVLLVESCTHSTIPETLIPTVTKINITVTPSEESSPIDGLQYNLLFIKESGLFLYDTSDRKATLLSVLSEKGIDEAILSPDGSHLAYKDDSGIYISRYPFESSMKIAAFDPGFWDLAWNPKLIFNSTGDRLAYTDKDGLYVWNIESASATLLMVHPEPVGDGNTFIHPESWSPDSHWLVIRKTSMEYFEFWVLNTTTKRMLPISVNRQSEIEWHSNSTLIAVVEYDCMALTGFIDGIYLMEIKDDVMSEKRIYHEETDPACGEREYSITGIDPDRHRIFFSRSTHLSTIAPSNTDLAITFDGTLLPEESGDCYTIAGVTELPDGRFLCRSKHRLYAFDPQTSETESILEWSPESIVWVDLPDKVTPDHNWILFTENYQYYLLNLQTHSRYQVTLDASPNEIYFKGWIKLDQLQ
jgi:hypothetical protein